MRTLVRELQVGLPGWVEEVVGPRRILPGTEEKMALVIRLAAANVERETGGGPFGAAVFRNDTGELIAAGVNSVVRLHNATLHAEVVALMLAHEAMAVHSFRLPGVPPLELVSSCDPCIMCLGATAWSGVTRLVTGAAKQDAEDLGFDEGPVTADSYAQLQRHGVEVVRGVLREEACVVLRRYLELGRPIY